MAIVEANTIRKEFGEIVAVNNVSFSIEKGQVVGLIGPNGAGKTTLLRILGTLLRPTSGRVRLLGYDLSTDYLDIRKQIGFLPDFFNLYNDLTLKECLYFFARAYDIQSKLIPERVEEVLKYIELQDKRDSLVRHLSRGMVQRVGIGILLVHNPELLLLDEPASGLDPKARIQLRRILTRLGSEGKTVVISSHILTELSGFCSHVAIMDRGRIQLFGAIEEIQQRFAGPRKVDISVLSQCEKAVALIGSFPNAKATAVHNDVITVEIAGDLKELARLNACLVRAGIEVVGFSEQKTDLEDLFMKISDTDAGVV